jgi:hypothetical protein
LVAAEEALAGQATDGVPGAEFFFEHVHFSFAGDYRVARAPAEAVERELAASIAQRRVEGWASQETCERRLGLTDWNRAGVLRDVLHRIQGAPCNRQASHEAQLQHWQTELAGFGRETCSGGGGAAGSAERSAGYGNTRTTGELGLSMLSSLRSSVAKGSLCAAARAIRYASFHCLKPLSDRIETQSNDRSSGRNRCWGRARMVRS